MGEEGLRQLLESAPWSTLLRVPPEVSRLFRAPRIQEQRRSGGRLVIVVARLLTFIFAQARQRNPGFAGRQHAAAGGLGKCGLHELLRSRGPFTLLALNYICSLFESLLQRSPLVTKQNDFSNFSFPQKRGPRQPTFGAIEGTRKPPNS